MTTKELAEWLEAHALHRGIVDLSIPRESFPLSEQQMAWDCLAAARRLKVLEEEVEAGRECVGPDPIYGWDEPRRLDDGEPGWDRLDAARAATDKERDNG